MLLSLNKYQMDLMSKSNSSRVVFWIFHHPVSCTAFTTAKYFNVTDVKYVQPFESRQGCLRRQILKWRDHSLHVVRSISMSVDCNSKKSNWIHIWIRFSFLPYLSLDFKAAYLSGLTGQCGVCESLLMLSEAAKGSVKFSLVFLQVNNWNVKTENTRGCCHPAETCF